MFPAHPGFAAANSAGTGYGIHSCGFAVAPADIGVSRSVARVLDGLSSSSAASFAWSRQGTPIEFLIVTGTAGGHEGDRRASGNAVVGASMSGSAALVRDASEVGTRLDASRPESATRISNKVFQARYQAGGGHDGVFDFPAHGTRTWSNWGEPLQAMLPDLQRVLNGLSR